MGRAYNKNQILSPRVGLGPKPNFFIYIVKPEPELSPTYLVTFSSPKKPEPKSWSPSLTRARKNQARPIPINESREDINGLTREEKKYFWSPMSLSISVIRIVHAMILFLLCFISINKNRLNKEFSQVM
jgi:hypothetical protein